VPLFDTLRVFSFRMLKGTSPFTPDRNHIHHILLRFRLSHTKVALSLGTVGFIFPLVAFFCKDLGTAWLIIGMVTVGFIVVGGLVFRYRFVSRSSLVKGGVSKIGKDISSVRTISIADRKVAGQE
jgi:hypothetical protein